MATQIIEEEFKGILLISNSDYQKSMNITSDDGMSVLLLDKRNPGGSGQTFHRRATVKVILTYDDVPFDPQEH